MSNQTWVHDDPLYKYNRVFPWERTFDDVWSTTWMQQNWSQSIVIAIMYVITIFAMQHYMSFRRRFEHLREAAVAWNTSLAVFSVVGLVRMMPEFTCSLGQGWEYSVCNNSFAQGVPLCWTWLFGLSKVVELGDTMFLLLKKKRPQFLHWYHHVTVLVYTWYSIQQHTASGRWFVTMNFAVHSCMYSYYALHEAGYRLPQALAMCITLLQLAQMLIGCTVNSYAYYVKTQHRRCDQSYTNLHAGLVMYASYFVLFAQFFINRYTMQHHNKQTVTNGVANGHQKTL